MMSRSSSDRRSNTRSFLHVLVIAHPDDESMFFVPTLYSLLNNNSCRRQKQEVWILCLTTGDYDGLGKQRIQELYAAGKLLGISKIFFYDGDDENNTRSNSSIKDHPTERWNIPAVSTAIETSISKHIVGSDENSWERIILLTFDEYGISGHVNHIDTYLGVCNLLRRKSNQGINIKIQQQSTSKETTTTIIPIEGWKLKSENNLFFKYIPIVCWIKFILSLFHIYVSPTTKTKASSTTTTLKDDDDNDNSRIINIHHECFKPWINWNAMKAHKTQFVWYRRLFVIFSIYTYCNELQRIMIVNNDDTTDTTTNTNTNTFDSSSTKKKSE